MGFGVDTGHSRQSNGEEKEPRASGKPEALARPLESVPDCSPVDPGRTGETGATEQTGQAKPCRRV